MLIRELIQLRRRALETTMVVFGCFVVLGICYWLANDLHAAAIAWLVAVIFTLASVVLVVAPVWDVIDRYKRAAARVALYTVIPPLRVAVARTPRAPQPPPPRSNLAD